MGRHGDVRRCREVNIGVGTRWLKITSRVDARKKGGWCGVVRAGQSFSQLEVASVYPKANLRAWFASLRMQNERTGTGW